MGYISEYDARFHTKSVNEHLKRLDEDAQYRATFILASMANNYSHTAADVYADALKELQPLKNELDRANQQVLERVSKHFQIPLHSLVLGGWDCPASPTLYCVYDERRDGSHDRCVVCGLPEERK